MNWDNMNDMNVEDSWNFFMSKVNNSINRIVPLKRVNQSKKKQKWADAACLSSIKIKHKTWNRYTHTKERTDYLRYCKARNQCTKITRTAKKKFEQSIIKNVKMDPKGFWGYVREKNYVGVKQSQKLWYLI